MFFIQISAVYLSQQKQTTMKALVNFNNSKTVKVIVNRSFSRGGVHYYNLTLNSLDTVLDFKAGETKLFSETEISRLTYIMS